MNAPVALHLGPGLHLDVPAARYHADPCAEPSLSSSIAHMLVAETPRHAWHAHPRLNIAMEERDATAAMDLGSVVHEMVLGRGPGFDVFEHDNWLKKDAKADRDASRIRGRIPILLKTEVQAEVIHDAILRAIEETQDAANFMHPDARSEVVGVWRDIGGPLCRLMADRLTPDGTVYDLKITGRGLDDLSLGRQLEDGYACRAAFILRGLQAIDPAMAGRLHYRWIFAESSAPYAVRIVEADARSIELGDRQAALGIATWHRCLGADHWPGWPRRVAKIGMGAWADNRIAEREAADTLVDDLPLALTGRILREAAE